MKDEQLLEALGSLAEEAEAEEAAALAELGDALKPPNPQMHAAVAERMLAAVAPAPVVPLKPRRRAWLALPALAAAAVLALVLWPGGGTLPSYTLTLSGAQQSQRGSASSDGEIVELAAQAQLELVLKPQRQVAQAVALRAYLREGETLRAWQVNAERASTGAFRIAGPAAALLPAGRTVEIILVVGREDRLPTSAAQLEAGGDWQQLRRRVRLAAP